MVKTIIDENSIEIETDNHNIVFLDLNDGLPIDDGWLEYFNFESLKIKDIDNESYLDWHILPVWDNWRLYSKR